MRAVRIALAGLLGLACALIGAPAAFAAGANINLDPAHGPANAAFTITYQYTGFGAGFCPVGRFAGVVIGWDGNAVGQTQLNRQTCSARARLRPPRHDRAGGQHRVTAVIPAVPGSRADTVYTIDAATMPTPTAAPADQQSTNPASGPTTDPAAGGTSAAVDNGAAQPAGSVAGTAATQAVANVAPSWLGWALVFGAALVLAGAGTFAFVIIRARREREEY